jgi:hypothetical protein
MRRLPLLPSVARPIPLVPPRMTTRLAVEMDIDVSRILYGTFVRSAGGVGPPDTGSGSGQFGAGREQALLHVGFGDGRVRGAPG